MTDPTIVFLENDFVLEYLYKAKMLGPALVFYVSVVLELVVLGVWAASNKIFFSRDIRDQIVIEHSLSDEARKNIRQQFVGSAHGFFSYSNLYLLFLPFLNFFIFQYYETVGLNLMRFATIHSGSVEEAHVLYGEAFSFVSSDMGVLASVVSWLVGACVFLAVVCQPLRYRGWTVTKRFFSLFTADTHIQIGDEQRLGRHDWLTNHGRSRMPLVFYFSTVVHLIQISIIVNWVFRHLILTFSVVPRLFNSLSFDAGVLATHPDGLFGFEAWENIAYSVFNVCLAIAVVVIVWIAGQRQRKGCWWGALIDPGPTAAAVAMIILVPLVLMGTLRAGHRELMEIKYHLLTQIDLRLLDPETVSRADVVGTPDWPIRGGAKLQIAFNAVLGAIGLTMPELIGKFVERFKKVKSDEVAEA